MNLRTIGTWEESHKDYLKRNSWVLDLIKELKHWKETRKKLSKLEKVESIRCAVDVASVIYKHTGIRIPKQDYI